MKQVKFQNRNGMADETVGYVLRLASLTLVLTKERQCQRNLDHRHPADRDL